MSEVKKLTSDLAEVKYRAWRLEARLMRAAVAAFDEARSDAEQFKPFNSAHEGFAFLKEGVDELWSDVKCNAITAARRAALRVAAMALRFLADCQ